MEQKLSASSMGTSRWGLFGSSIGVSISISHSRCRVISCLPYDIVAALHLSLRRLISIRPAEQTD